jgi:hypothetical protein
MDCQAGSVPKPMTMDGSKCASGMFAKKFLVRQADCRKLAMHTHAVIDNPFC